MLHVVTGLLSAYSCLWLLDCAWQLSGGEDINKEPLGLTDLENGSDPADAAFVAVTVLIHWILMPMWFAMFAVGSVVVPIMAKVLATVFVAILTAPLVALKDKVEKRNRESAQEDSQEDHTQENNDN